MITALCGGVGGSKLALGLYRTLRPEDLTVIVNTADDLELWGLHMSPDLDTVTYTLAGLAQRTAGWGIEGDTFHALEMLRRYGDPDWFQVGDADLATHLFRTGELRRGSTLSQATDCIRRALGVGCRILPMTDAPVATRLLVDEEWVEFQEYFVHRRHSVPVEAVRYDGAGQACPAPGVLESIQTSEVIVIVNSNPVLSICPMLSLPGVREALAGCAARRVAVSPIVGPDAVGGLAGVLVRLAGQPASATGVAGLYADLIDGIVIDRRDKGQADAIRELGIEVLCTDTLMRNESQRMRLASETVAFARSLR